MNKKLTGILIISSGLILIVVIIYFVFFYNFNKEPVADEQSTIERTETPSLPKTVKPVLNKPVLLNVNKIDSNSQKFTSENLESMAASFAERFGSYSNHSNFENISDLKIFMSSSMQIWADSFIKKAQLEYKYSEIYYGITTKAIAQNLKEFDEENGKAIILVNTQRRESSGTMNNISVLYQDIILTFIKENGAWKVNSAYWQD